MGIRMLPASLNSFVQRERHKIPNKLQHGVKGVQYWMWLEEEGEKEKVSATSSGQEPSFLWVTVSPTAS